MPCLKGKFRHWYTVLNKVFTSYDRLDDTALPPYKPVKIHHTKEKGKKNSFC